MMHVSIWLLVSVTDVTVDVSIQKSPSLTLYKSVRGLFLKSCTGNLLKENIRKDHINRSYHLTSEGKGGGKDTWQPRLDRLHYLPFIWVPP